MNARKRLLIAVLLIIVSTLSACDGEKADPTQASGDAPAFQASVNSAQAEEAVPGTPDAAHDGLSEAAVTTSDEAVFSATESLPVDLDLTKLSSTVVYSQVFDMMTQPEAYKGRRIRIKGKFSYFQDPNTHQEYFATIIADATACCAQGIEFVWRGKHIYPQDYPPLETEVTVTGAFDTYYEENFMYIRLINAELSW